MTSILIDEFHRKQALAREIQRQNSAQDCTFCAIIKGELPAFKVFEDEHLIAFLDILPIRPGHTLLIPKAHHAKIDTSAHMARILPRLCRAVCKATSQEDFNIVNNNGYAQVVPHVHWHIVPAPKLGQSSAARSSSNNTNGITMSELYRRSELDDEDAAVLTGLIKDAYESDASREARL